MPHEPHLGSCEQGTSCSMIVVACDMNVSLPYIDGHVFCMFRELGLY